MLKATLSFHHKQTHALFKSTKESQIDQDKKAENSNGISTCELWKKTDLYKGM